jgi:hypothetical protein
VRCGRGGEGGSEAYPFFEEEGVIVSWLRCLDCPQFGVGGPLEVPIRHEVACVGWVGGWAFNGINKRDVQDIYTSVNLQTRFLLAFCVCVRACTCVCDSTNPISNYNVLSVIWRG